VQYAVLAYKESVS